ncbi:uncharacterized protein V6R79_015358 [Siganus canaliculatus]
MLCKICIPPPPLSPDFSSPAGYRESLEKAAIQLRSCTTELYAISVQSAAFFKSVTTPEDTVGSRETPSKCSCPRGGRNPSVAIPTHIPRRRATATRSLAKVDYGDSRTVHTRLPQPQSASSAWRRVVGGDAPLDRGSVSVKSERNEPEKGRSAQRSFLQQQQQRQRQQKHRARLRSGITGPDWTE